LTTILVKLMSFASDDLVGVWIWLSLLRDLLGRRLFPSLSCVDLYAIDETIRIAGLEVLGVLPSLELAKLHLSRRQPMATVGHSFGKFMKSHPAPRLELSFAGTR
jgi:hypothetical protein